MQPLRLHVLGLHSFRTPVEVDFGWLGAHGLFGIFGPVGSGKSTLLDAMTLALYGAVDRLAGRSRRGIVNAAVGRCEVRLRFRVGEQEWEVHRTYRADDDGVAQRVHSRLARAEGAHLRVVADKEREVNAGIEGLLGLTAQDFMRAVVLPQGRFMQFLHLQGADRRRMLQRIFRLEAWGEELRARVKVASDELDGALQHVVGELEGLGATGPEARTAAEVEVVRADAEATRARDRRATAHADAERARAARAHHAALDAARKELDGHLASAVGVADLAERIQVARRVRPALRSWLAHQDALAAETASGRAAASARAELDAALAAEQTSSELAARADRELAEEAPALEARRASAEAALGVAGELAEVAARAHRAAQRRGQLQRRQDEDEAAQAAEEARLELLVARRTESRAAWTATGVPPGVRDTVRRSEAARLAMEAARKRADATRSSAEDARRRAQGALDAARVAREAESAGQVRRAAVEADLARLDAQREAASPLLHALERAASEGLPDRIRSANERLARAESSVRDAEVRLAEAEAALSHAAPSADRALLAGLLAGGLAPGATCPVCGSPEHPAPAPTRDPAELWAIAAERARAAAVRDARREALGGAVSRREEARMELAELQERVPAGLRDLTGAVSRAGLVSAAFERARSRAERALANLAATIQGARELAASAEARASAADEEHQRLEVEHAVSARRVTSAWEELGAALAGRGGTDEHGALTLFDLPRLVAEIERKDVRRAELDPEVQAAEAALGAAQAGWERRRDAMASRRSELERVKLELSAAEARREELLALLRAASPEGDPAGALREADRRLQELRDAAARRAGDRERARARLLEATGAEAAARSAWAAARERAARTAAALDADLAGDSPADLRARAMEGADLDALDGQVRRWSEARAALAARLDDLLRVDLPPVTPAELDRSEREASEADGAHREAERAAARARERLDDLARRAERADALGARHRELSVRSARLGTLARLLRGDRFVEWVANDHLRDLVDQATVHLASLTRGRYALGLDEEGGFLIADLDAGGASRPASSLSGGETFLASLALALALSAQVQRHSRSPLEFFFLDEGFGSLDPEALDRVMTAIEGLGDGRRVIGLISHVAAVRERVPRHLELSCPRDGGGTRIVSREA